jgi:hypothetical protein
MKFPSTLGRSVIAMIALCTLFTIGALAAVVFASGGESVARRVHEYRHADGVVSRVADPWRPLPGCLFLQSAEGEVLWPLDGENSYNSAMTGVCGRTPLVLADSAAPPALSSLLLSANNLWRAPLQRSDSLPMNAVERDGLAIPQGAHVDITLDAVRQAKAQSLVACMTGHVAACAAVGVAEQSWAQNSEDAAARMFGVVVLDVKTGAIEALASSHSACYEAEHSGASLPDHCPTPALMRKRPLPGMLGHHALADAKPGSLVKPIMILAFMRDPLLGPKLRVKGSAARNALLDDIKNSDSPNFLDRAYCRDLHFAKCARLQRISDAASDLGWNLQTGNPMALAQRDTAQAAFRMATPHFLQTVNSQGQWQGIPLQFDGEQAKECAIGNRWHQCRGEVANTASELIGQGNAMASPLTIAEMLKGIANAANGAREQVPAHLLQSVHGRLHGQGATLLPDEAPVPLRIGKEEANLVLEGMSLTHHGGTASSGCLNAYADTPDAAGACRRLLGVAGKTGTPGFADEAYTWAQRTQVCNGIQQRLAQDDLSTEPRRYLTEARARCVQSPFKWYAAVLRADPASNTGPWSKIVVVLAERNYRRDGWIDSKGDVGSPNVAAELGFRLIKGWQ